MSKPAVSFLVGLLLASAAVTAQVVRYGVQSNGTPLPTRPAVNFGAGITCVDDPATGTTNCSNANAAAYWADAGSGSISSLGTINNGASGLRFANSAGQNAIALQTNGAQIDLGTGTFDYLYSDGVAVNAAGTLQAPLLYSPSAIVSAGYSTATSFISGGRHTTAGLPTTPASGATTYNTSDQTLNVSNGSNWVGVPMEWVDSTYVPARPGGTLGDFTYFVASYAGSVKGFNSGWYTTGGGTGNVTYAIFKNGTATACTWTTQCDLALAGGASCNIQYAPGDSISYGLVANACTGAGTGTGKVTVIYSGAAH